MNFCTLSFFLFFVAVFTVYWAISGRKARAVIVLATGSYFLYATWRFLSAVPWSSLISSWGDGTFALADVGQLFQNAVTFHWYRDILDAAVAPGYAVAVYWLAGIVFIATSLSLWIGHHQARVWLLLMVSFYFYACFNGALAAIICVSTAMDYGVARGLDASSSPRFRRLLLGLSLVANLGLLVYFKYANFFLDSLNRTLEAVGAEASLPTLSVILPIGISFYTFEAINYTIDVYRRRVPAEKDLGNFMLFITFFPHLVAGPIVRARDFLPQIHRRKRWSWARMQLGVQYVLMGLFKKWAIADRLALGFADPVFEHPDLYNTGAVWLALLAYALQIYCDFSGYTDMALGLAHMLGYKLAKNFNMPYIAANVSEFWRRWHISLSSWLRDYLFIPLGGSRGSGWMTCRNLMITMTLGGLWHGANWTFVVWGILHGLFLVIHRSFKAFCEHRPILDRALQTAPGYAVRMASTFLCVCVAWVFFRSQTFATAATFLQHMFSHQGGLGSPLHNRSLWYTVVLVAICHILGQRGLWKRIAVRLPAPVLGFGYATALTLSLLLAPPTGKTFIYFQF
jgi:alginate O-acetyltransferase complex protein AlgI